MVCTSVGLCGGGLVDDHFAAQCRQKRPRPIAAQAKCGSSRSILKYWLTARRIFADPGVVHLTLDAGTLGKKSTVCGLIALPDNQAMIFAPQATVSGRPPP